MINKVSPTVYFLVCLVIIITLRILVDAEEVVPSQIHYFGWVLMFFGLMMIVMSEREFKRLGTTLSGSRKPTAFIRQGPFRLSRHPIYLGMTSILLGVSVLLMSWPGFIPPLLFGAIMEWGFIPGEEKTMKEIFGEEYEAYRKRVRKWF